MKRLILLLVILFVFADLAAADCPPFFICVPTGLYDCEWQPDGTFNCWPVCECQMFPIIYWPALSISMPSFADDLKPPVLACANQK